MGEHPEYRAIIADIVGRLKDLKAFWLDGRFCKLSLVGSKLYTVQTMTPC